jgi:soluble lytic murein transglycosylase-like protein
VRRWTALARRVAREVGLDPAWILAVVARESSGDPRARSPRGAVGLMQLLPGTAREMGVRDPWDPYENLLGGARYLKRLLERFGDPRLALAAYHAGPRRVEEAGGLPPIPATHRYVADVLRLKGALERTAG